MGLKTQFMSQVCWAVGGQRLQNCWAPGWYPAALILATGWMDSSSWPVRWVIDTGLRASFYLPHFSSLWFCSFITAAMAIRTTYTVGGRTYGTSVVRLGHDQTPPTVTRGPQWSDQGMIRLLPQWPGVLDVQSMTDFPSVATYWLLRA